MIGVRQAALDVRDLGRGEHLLVFGFRAMALGRSDCPVLRRTFTGLLGGEGEASLGHLLAFVRTVGWVGRRPLRVHVPGCVCLTDDERRMLGVLAAAQASLVDGEEEALKAGLEGLLGGPAPESCLFAAQALAAALLLGGMELPSRAFSPTHEVGDVQPTLH